MNIKQKKDNIFITIYIILGLVLSIMSWCIIILVNLKLIEPSGIFYFINFIGGAVITAITITNIRMLMDIKKIEKEVKNRIEKSRKITEEEIIEKVKKEKIKKFLFVINEIKNKKEN